MGYLDSRCHCLGWSHFGIDCALYSAVHSGTGCHIFQVCYSHRNLRDRDNVLISFQCGTCRSDLNVFSLSALTFDAEHDTDLSPSGYQSEISPPAMRGTIVGSLQLFNLIGQILASGINRGYSTSEERSA